MYFDSSAEGRLSAETKKPRLVVEAFYRTCILGNKDTEENLCLNPSIHNNLLTTILLKVCYD